jgi:hypothetical protein
MAVDALRTLTPSPFPAFGRKRQEEENEGAGLAPSCSPSQCGRLMASTGSSSSPLPLAGEGPGVRA